MTHPTVSNEAVRAYLRDRKSGQYPDLPSASNLTPASKKVWSVFLDAAGEVVKKHYSENIIAKTLHGERKDALEIAASLDWFKVFQRLGSDITGDVGFWRWATTNTPNFFEFVRWRDGSLDSWPKKEAAFGIMRLLGDSPECVALRMYRRGLICTRGHELKLWEDPSEVAGTDLWRSGVLRRAIGNSPDAAAIYVQAVVEISKTEKISLTQLARTSAKRVNRLRPLFQWEAMQANEMKTLIVGQVMAAQVEARAQDR